LAGADVIVLIDRDACDLAEDPVLRQRFGPERLDLEFRRAFGAGLPGKGGC
jgi:hypothetical protein